MSRGGSTVARSRSQHLLLEEAAGTRRPAAFLTTAAHISHMSLLQDNFAQTWAIGVGVDVVVQFKNAFTSVVQSLIVFTVVGSAFGPAKWLGMWLDAASIQARAVAPLRFRRCCI